VSFNEHIQEENSDECWNWTGAKTMEYGTFERLYGRRRFIFMAHRLAWMFYHRKPIPDGMHILHKCDNPSCCNPRHLFLGSQADNMRDRDSKGRNGRAKLSKGDVYKIRRLLSLGTLQRKIAKRFNVDRGTISAIKQKRNWKWLA
jgi:hypothetical protein